MQLIGIAGPARAGKDTLCDYLKIALQDQGHLVTRYAFADPIKWGLAAAFMLSDNELYGATKETPIPEFGHKSPREMMQWFGTDYARNMIDPEIWLTVAGKHVNVNRSNCDFMIIPDVRFNNEGQWIRNRGGIVIHVERDERPSVTDHVSENGVLKLDPDWRITNNGSLTDLATNAVYFVDHHPRLAKPNKEDKWAI